MRKHYKSPITNVSPTKLESIIASSDTIGIDKTKSADPNAEVMSRDNNSENSLWDSEW